MRTLETTEGARHRPAEAGTKLSAVEFKMLQLVPDVGLTKTGLRRLFPGLAINAQLRTLRALIRLGLVVETQSDGGDVRFDLTDAGRRLAKPD
jgi:hypothetical protein